MIKNFDLDNTYQRSLSCFWTRLATSVMYKPSDSFVRVSLPISETVGIDLARGDDETAVIEIENTRIKTVDIVKTDCKYYSGSPFLICAVNTNCQGCKDYTVKE